MKKIRKPFIVVLALSILLLVSAISFNYVEKANVQSKVDANVLIETFEIGFDGREVYAVGSGVNIDKNGLIVTARHVVDGAKNVRITCADGRQYNDCPIFLSDESDVAIIDIPGTNHPFSNFILSRYLEKDSKVICVGNPGGIRIGQIVHGDISEPNFRRLAFHDDPLILCDIIICKGFSGGGVYTKGKLIGIISKGGMDFAFIVPSDEIVKALEKSKMR